ncbi:outer membrane beta-barrel protein [Cocleimonas sp. KMM 6892]|uniref:outer membrane beta-barrel protein n=1 Tax=unclassified Cocleimonas TaxID=2639732 RepID=UPI002DB6EB56|nr:MULTISPECIES: outer membrane beta-barrel protein [unclassified Cocleimonas]MEB8432255.1 outer membrane beta-barrel protein [Cocleimonas sp. KMM 6892]MEC4714659.1 outer membrane beta-barrel protein [Cocleimonas sp. KMM 6895]MEC4744527.1 outer membrane beta-barrel protein [Cocleimonas sp. KMM 6896]
MKSLKKSVILLGLISIVSVSYADLPKPFDYKKASTNYVDNTSGGFGSIANPYFFGGSIGASEASSYCSGESNCEDTDTAWKIFGGYKFTDKLSVEGAYMNLGDIYKNGQNSDVSAFSAYGVGTLPVTEQFDVFGKVGATRWSSDNTDGTESGFGASFGVGAKMHINENTKLRAEWEKVLDVETSDSESSDINMLSVGVELSTF